MHSWLHSTDADFGLRDQLGPPPRLQGRKQRVHSSDRAEWTDRNWSAVETIFRTSMGKKPRARMIPEKRESLPSRAVGDEALRGAQRK
jgi:hypothetical protein